MADKSALRYVLVVEDEDNIAAALEYVILREGLSHDRVASGSDAISRIRQTTPDLVLLDIMLPEVSGYDICRDIRRDPALKGVKVVMMTARGSTLQRAKCFEVGADGFITKPFELKALRDEIHRQLDA
ncbi:MAG: response regulator [Pseudomonadota bacterium]